MRLVLGTLLDVSEDDAEDESGDDTESDAPNDEGSDASTDTSDDTVAMQREVYDYLGWLLHACLDRLRA